MSHAAPIGTPSPAEDAARPDPAVDLASEAYLYYFPLVFNLEQVRRFAEHGVGQVPAAPYNVFSHARKLATDKDTFVTINNDTLYSMAQLDLSTGPIVLTVPATHDRYLVLQFVDAWTDNFAYVGTRATGSEGGVYLIVPTGYEGEVPEGMTRITAPTDIVSIVGRFACSGPHDLHAVHHLQDALELATLWEGVAHPEGVIDPDPVIAEFDFWEKARAWSQAYPPSPADQEGQKSFDDCGTTAALSPYVQPKEGLLETLVAGEALGAEKLEYFCTHAGATVVGGWAVELHGFDYNASFFEIGTIDTPEWIIADPAKRFVTRATAARLGLWGNHGYEAVYAQAFVDASGAPLDGSASYTIRFDEDPPVGAFWSVTLYDLPDYYLVANPIDRYSLGDRTEGIVRDGDGSLTITVSHAEPGDHDARANWLPAPAGPFRLVLRMYLPGPELLESLYTLPPIQRA